MTNSQQSKINIKRKNKMKFTREKVFDVCNTIAPMFKFDPIIIKAVCLQEGGKNKDGTFAPDRARLEQGFYSRYVEKNNLATTSEILLSASYGVMQIMGLELMRLGFFEMYFNQSTSKNIFIEPLSQLCIPSGLDAFCENLNWQIEWGCKLMAEKRAKANGDMVRMLLYWNGGSNETYPLEVIDKMKNL